VSSGSLLSVQELSYISSEWKVAYSKQEKFDRKEQLPYRE
jgi:hypothetical protein